MFCCPLCLCFKIYDNDDDQKVFDALYCQSLEKFSFLTVQNLLMHLHYTHNIDQKYTIEFDTFINMYKFRGVNGLVDTFMKKNALKTYWDGYRKEYYNELVKKLKKKQFIHLDLFFEDIDANECDKIFYLLKKQYFDDEDDFEFVDLD
jgi:hypothetical protein